MPFSNNDDIIDSRDIIERLDELENDEERDADDQEELEVLQSLDNQGRDYCLDWPHGVTLIRDGYFKEYARNYANDVGAIPDDFSWPTYCIDWEFAARELQMDYNQLDFDGVDYWAR